MRKTIALLIGALLLQPLGAHASGADLAISASSISFSTDTFYAGDTVRIYTSIRNIGDVDTTGHVLFFLSAIPIGRSQAVSLRANGPQDEVFVDFTVPEGSFNIRAVIQGTSPQDTNPDNDSALTPLYTTISDADRDSVVDDDDNCVDVSNADQSDVDGDGVGNACDSVDDRAPVAEEEDDNPTVSQETPGVQTPVTQPVAAASSSPAQTSSTPVSSPVSSSEAATEAAQISSPIATVATSLLTTSPYARFTYRQIDWRTYEFALAEQPESGVQFSWDFGDGASSVQSKITHAFAGPGSYAVTLAIVDENGSMASDAVTIDVSFFHLDNPELQMTLALLFILLAGLAVVLVKLRKREAYD